MPRKKVDLVGRESLADEVRPRGPGNFAGRAVDEAKANGIPIGEETPSKENPLDAAPSVPTTVRDGHMYSHFLVPVYSQNAKTGQRFVSLRMSFPLTPPHHELLPEEVTDAWDFMTNGDTPEMKVKHTDHHDIAFKLSPGDTPLCEIASAQLTKMVLKVTTEKGKGATVVVYRFAFEIRVPHSKKLCEWADANFGNDFWITMTGSQRKLR